MWFLFLAYFLIGPWDAAFDRFFTICFLKLFQNFCARDFEPLSEVNTMYILSFLTSLIKGVKRAFAQTVLSLEAENRFPSSWNRKFQKLLFGCLLRIRTDTTRKGYQHVTMCLIIQISLKEVRRTTKLLHNLFWKGLASSIEKKKNPAFLS